LNVVTGDGGLHTVKTQGDTAEKQKWKSSPRKERWQSTRKRVEDKKNSIDAQKDNFFEIARVRHMGAQNQGSNDQEHNVSILRETSLPAATSTNVARDFQEPRLRGVTMGNAHVRFLHPLEGRRFAESSFERNTFEENEQFDPENSEKGEQLAGITNQSSNGFSEGNMAEFYVALEDGTTKEDDELNCSQETQF